MTYQKNVKPAVGKFIPAARQKPPSADALRDALADCCDALDSLPQDAPLLLPLLRQLLPALSIGTQTPVAQVMHKLAEATDKNKFGENSNAYHSRTHFAEVVLSGVAIDILNAAQASPPSAAAPDALAMGLFLRLIHDLGHPGLGNTYPMANENQSWLLALPFLQAAHFSPDQLSKMRAVVLATDPAAPKNFAHDCYRYHMANGAGAGGVPPPELDPKMHLLAPLLESAETATLAMSVLDSDVLPSGGISLLHAARNTLRLEAEIGKELGPLGTKYFLEKIIGLNNEGRVEFATKGAQAIGNGVANQLYQQALADLQATQDKTASASSPTQKTSGQTKPAP